MKIFEVAMSQKVAICGFFDGRAQKLIFHLHKEKIFGQALSFCQNFTHDSLAKNWTSTISFGMKIGQALSLFALLGQLAISGYET